MRCTHVEAQTEDLHPCPYDEDINDDHEPYCTCCDECMSDCCDDI